MRELFLDRVDWVLSGSLDGWGGWRYRECEEFIEWASRYDDGARAGPNLKRHEAWLTGLPCRVVRIDGTRPTRELVAQVLGRSSD